MARSLHVLQGNFVTPQLKVRSRPTVLCVVRLGTIGGNRDGGRDFVTFWSDGKDDADSDAETLALRDPWALNKDH